MGAAPDVYVSEYTAVMFATDEIGKRELCLPGAACVPDVVVRVPVILKPTNVGGVYVVQWQHNGAAVMRVRVEFEEDARDIAAPSSSTEPWVKWAE